MDGIKALSGYSPAAVAAEDRMVNIELEAAEALAGLAHSAVSENHGGDSAVDVPVEMPPVHPEYFSVSEPPNLAKDHEILQQNSHKRLYESISKPIKNEEISEVELNGACTTSYAPSGLGKSRQYLNEAEKEARRIRRVLANRESARQTIRRRQAIFEELTRKAADLAWENENLKKEKELAVYEYDSLRTINKTLKAQITEVVKVDVQEIRPEIAPPPLAENSPLLYSNQPAFFPFLWPQIVQQPNSLQINNSPGTPLYLLPCPWLFPLSHQQEQAFNLNDKPNEISLNTHYIPCSSAETRESHHLLPVKVNAETSVSQFHNNSFGFPPDGGGQQGGSRSKGNVLMPIPLRCVRADINVEHEKCSQFVDVCEDKSSDKVISGILEKSHETMSGKKVEDVTVAAATEARKRRKELTKLKNLNCRQFRMHYLEKG